MLTLCFGNLALLAGDSQLVFTLSTVLISMGVLANSMQSGLVADLVPERLVGRGMGMYRFTADLGVVIGPLILGVLLDRFGFLAASVAGAIVVLSGVVAITALVPRKTAGTVQPTP
jgi:predicted MFS family arabinose efflux permease